MNKNSARIGTVFILFIVPMVFLSMVNTGNKSRGNTGSTGKSTLTSVVRAHICNGSAFVLKQDGELMKNGKLFKKIPNDTIDFHVSGERIYVLKQDGLYLNEEKLIEIAPEEGNMPYRLIIVPLITPQAHIIFADGSHIVKELSASDSLLEGAAAKLQD
jgi:hypothetical protein